MEYTDRRTESRMSRQTARLPADIWMDERTDRQMNRQTDEQINRWMGDS